MLAVLDQHVDFHIGIEGFEKRSCDAESGHDDGIAAVHHALELHISRYNAFRRYIPARWPQIFGQGGANEIIYIEIGNITWHVAIVRRLMSVCLYP